MSTAYLSLAQELLELVLGQQAVVLHEGRHLWGTLGLIVDGAVDLHVAVQNSQEVLLALSGRRNTPRWWNEHGYSQDQMVYFFMLLVGEFPTTNKLF